MKQFFYIKSLFMLLFVCFLTACVTMPASQQSYNQKMSWHTRQKQLTKVKRWKIEGAIAVRLPQKAFSANLNWHQQLTRYQMNLFGPLGFGAVVIQGKPGSLTLETSEGKHFTAKNPEALIQQQLGWILPVSNLYYWIRGLPAPHIPSTKRFDRYHHITTLSQKGWSIRYLQYTGIQGVDLPSNIVLENSQIKLHIVISQWEISH